MTAEMMVGTKLMVMPRRKRSSGHTYPQVDRKREGRRAITSVSMLYLRRPDSPSGSEIVCGSDPWSLHLRSAKIPCETGYDENDRGMMPPTRATCELCQVYVQAGVRGPV